MTEPVVDELVQSQESGRAAAGERSEAAARPWRFEHLDAWRGLAVVLMVADHVMAFSGGWELFRASITRPAMPVFMVVAGALWRPGLRRRHVELVAAAAAAGAAFAVLGFPGPEILAVFVVAHLVATTLDERRVPIVAVAIGGWIQATYWPLFAGRGYELGTVLLFLSLGRMVGESRLGAPRILAPLEVLGRRPLTVYVGHLLVLVVVQAVTTWR